MARAALERSSARVRERLVPPRAVAVAAVERGTITDRAALVSTAVGTDEEPPVGGTSSPAAVMLVQAEVELLRATVRSQKESLRQLQEVRSARTCGRPALTAGCEAQARGRDSARLQEQAADARKLHETTAATAQEKERLLQQAADAERAARGECVG